MIKRKISAELLIALILVLPLAISGAILVALAVADSQNCQALNTMGGISLGYLCFVTILIVVGIIIKLSLKFLFSDRS